VWGVYTYRPPQKGVGPPRRARAHSRKEIPCVPFLDMCPKTDVPFQDTRSPAWCGKANEYVCSPLGMACASSGSMVITTSLTIETHYGKLYLSPGILKSDIDGGDSLDGIESLILAHYMAGVDVSSKGYIDGINTALNNLKTHSN
jgi:hypothetical protein